METGIIKMVQCLAILNKSFNHIIMFQQTEYITNSQYSDIN